MDLALWIGEEAYPKPADFINEARALGISRKVNSLPAGFTMGTRVFLMHKDGTKNGKIIGFFTVSELDVVVQDKHALDDKVQEFLQQGARLVTMAMVALEPRRGCGWRKPGGVYLVQTITQDGLVELAMDDLLKKDIMLKGDMVVFPRPFSIPANAKHFRGWMGIDGDALIADLQSNDYKGSINYYRFIEVGEDMTFGDFIDELAVGTGQSVALAGKVVRAAFLKVKEIVAGGDTLTVPGFGTFRSQKQAASAGTAPDGTDWTSPEKMVPKFKASPKFRTEVTDGQIDSDQSGGEDSGNGGDPDVVDDASGEPGNAGDTA